ncbi:MAG: hypothetical protein LBM77_01265 [Spirochaetaceae bacterium]|jgi:hypothetical protein|nr:hypothetical protein [Spirochaetaceae bacterium]
MEPVIEFIDTAFNHKVPEADIRWAFETFVFEERIAETKDKYVIVGFDRTGNPLEVMFNQVDEDTIEVFHAMKCRAQWKKKAGI